MREALQDVGWHCLSRKGELRAGDPGELRKLLEQRQLRERWMEMEKGRKALQKKLNECVVGTGEV